MDEKIFQEVWDKIQDYLPDGWKKVVFFAGYTEGSYGMKFYCKSDGGSYIDCFRLPGAIKTKLIRTFMDVDKILAKERKKLDGKNKWTVFTMMVDADGNMKAEFDYSDYSEDMISYEREWKNKYLLY